MTLSTRPGRRPDPHGVRVGLEAGQQLRPPLIGQPQVVGNMLGAVDRIVPVVPADHQHAPVSGPNLHRRRQPRRAAADYRDVVHWYSPSPSPKSAATTAAISGSAIS